MDIPLHPACEMFPPMSESEFESLCDNVAFEGLLEPIVVIYDDTGKIQQILDGRSRYLACLKTKVEPRFVLYTGSDPYMFVCQKNLHRRHLTIGQRAIIADRMREALREQRVIESQSRGGIRSQALAKQRGLIRSGGIGAEHHPDTGMVPKPRKSELRQEVATAMRVGVNAVSDAASLREHPDLLAEVERGALGIETATKERKRREKPENIVKEIVKKNHQERLSTYQRANTDVEINNIKKILADIRRSVRTLQGRDQELVSQLTYEFFGHQDILSMIDYLSDIARKESITIVTVGSS